MWTTLKLHSKVQGPPNHDPSVSRASQPNPPKKIRNLCFYGGLELLESRWKHHIKASKNSTIITNFRSIWRKHHDLYQKDIVWWRPTYRCKCRHPEILFQSVANHIYCHAGKNCHMAMTHLMRNYGETHYPTSSRANLIDGCNLEKSWQKYHGATQRVYVCRKLGICGQKMQLVTSTIFRIHHTHHTANDGMIRNDHKKIKVHTVTCSHGFHSNIPTHKYIPVAHLMSNCGYPKIATSKLNEIPTHSHIVWKL